MLTSLPEGLDEDIKSGACLGYEDKFERKY